MTCLFSLIFPLLQFFSCILLWLCMQRANFQKSLVSFQCLVNPSRCKKVGQEYSCFTTVICKGWLVTWQKGKQPKTEAVNLFLLLSALFHDNIWACFMLHSILYCAFPQSRKCPVGFPHSAMSTAYLFFFGLNFFLLKGKSQILPIKLPEHLCRFWMES